MDVNFLRPWWVRKGSAEPIWTSPNAVWIEPLQTIYILFILNNEEDLWGILQPAYLSLILSQKTADCVPFHIG